MHLEGSCHCGAVTFSLDSETPYPYMRCYCSICRKTGGGGGFAVNILGHADTLSVEGADNMTVYRVKRQDGHLSDAHRHFCKHCGSALYVSDPRWPDLVHPFASAIDSGFSPPPVGQTAKAFTVRVSSSVLTVDHTPPSLKAAKVPVRASDGRSMVSLKRIEIVSIESIVEPLAGVATPVGGVTSPTGVPSPPHAVRKRISASAPRDHRSVMFLPPRVFSRTPVRNPKI